MVRLATPHDFNFIYNLYMHPQVNPYLLYEQMQPEAFRPVYEKLIEAGIKYLYLKDGQPMGMFKLVPLLYRNDHIVYLGGLAINPDVSSKGEGSKMLLEIIEFAKQKGYLRIELSVATINERAIHMYEKNGFVKEGVLRKFTHLKNENRFLDEALMSYLVE